MTVLQAQKVHSDSQNGKCKYSDQEACGAAKASAKAASHCSVVGVSDQKGTVG
jgi:hypothetical protein